jgi:hypothetical protein
MSDEKPTALAVALPAGSDPLWHVPTFEHAQRAAKLFAASALVPQHLRNKPADVAIALMMSRRINEDPLILMQNMYSVHGSPGWNAQYMIARANRSEVFSSRINWRETGKGDKLEVTAYATLAESGEEVSASVSMEMAKAEGWTKNPKYKSMPALMLRYRSATFLVRLFAPEIMLGLSTQDEIDDIRAAGAEPVEVQDVTPAKPPPASVAEFFAEREAEPVEDAEVVEVVEVEAVEVEAVEVQAETVAEDGDLFAELPA